MSGTDLVSALHELDELFDDSSRRGDVFVVTAQRQPVAAQGDRAAEPLPERVEDAVLHARELRGDLVRDIEHLLHRLSVGRGSAATPGVAGVRAADGSRLSPGRARTPWGAENLAGREVPTTGASAQASFSLTS